MKNFTAYEVTKLKAIEIELSSLEDKHRGIDKLYRQFRSKKRALEKNIEHLKDEKQDLIDGQMTFSDSLEL